MCLLEYLYNVYTDCDGNFLTLATLLDQRRRLNDQGYCYTEGFFRRAAWSVLIASGGSMNGRDQGFLPASELAQALDYPNLSGKGPWFYYIKRGKPKGALPKAQNGYPTASRQRIVGTWSNQKTKTGNRKIEIGKYTNQIARDLDYLVYDNWTWAI